MTQLNAEELADIIVEKKLKMKRRSYEALKAKCYKEITKMAAEANTQVVVELDDSDLNGLTQVTEELRELDYKFKFIEVVNENDEVLKHKLLISVAHLSK